MNGIVNLIGALVSLVFLGLLTGTVWEARKDEKDTPWVGVIFAWISLLVMTVTLSLAFWESLPIGSGIG